VRRPRRRLIPDAAIGTLLVDEESPLPRNGRRPQPILPAGVDETEPEKRRAILHAAVKVFAEKGYQGCRIADVARQAGVAYGLVYHYFRNKDALLESVFAEQWTIFINALQAIADGPGTAPEQLAGVCRFAIDVFRTAPAAVRVLLLEVARTPDAFRAGSTRQTFEQAVRIIAGIVRRGQERGEIRPDASPEVAAAGLLGALELSLTGMVIRLVDVATDEDVERVKKDVVDLVLHGVAVR
jgi:TetR/AcrR family transcriptional regulator, fatty acid metabolism regulator protein